MAPSPALTRFLGTVALLPDIEPATLDDANELLDVLSDDELARLCVTSRGLPIRQPQKALCWTSTLRARIWNELADLEMTLPADNAEGYLKPILHAQ